MQRTLGFLSFVVLVVVTSVSAQAACGGGGYKVVTPAVKVGSGKSVSVATSSTSSTQYASQPVYNSKLADAQKDIDKAQAKLDRCSGDCEKERRKLQEAQAKYARKVAGA